MMFSNINFGFMQMYQPSLSVKANRTEIFNEWAILMCCHAYIQLLNDGYPKEAKELVGYAFVAIAGFNIFGNLCVTVYQSFTEIGKSVVANYYKYKHLAILDERLFRRRYLIESAPGEF